MASLNLNTQYSDIGTRPKIADLSGLIKNIQARARENVAGNVQNSIASQFNPEVASSIFSPLKSKSVQQDIRDVLQTGTPITSQQDTRYEPVPYYTQFAPSKAGDPWSSPTDKTVIRNFPTSLGAGQYYTDPSQRGALIKGTRVLVNEKTNPGMRKSILGKLPSSLFQVDHIVPLWIGGADTMANLQVLGNKSHDKKTAVQAVPLTLLANGKINLNQAKAMAFSWQDKKIDDIPQLDENGYVSLKVAQQYKDKWEAEALRGPSTKEFFKESFLEEMGNFGEGWLPDPLREFVKGALGGVTAHIVPGTEVSEDAGTVDKGAHLVGDIAGTIFGLGKLAKGISFVRGKQARSLQGWKKAMTLTNKAKKAAGVTTVGATGVKEIVRAGVDKGSFKATVKSIARGETLTRMAKTAGLLSLWGQIGLSGREAINSDLDAEFSNHLSQFYIDVAFGALLGSSSHRLRGFAKVGLGVATISVISGEEIVPALENAALMTALHAMGLKRGMVDPKMRIARNESYKMSADIMNSYSKGSIPEGIPGTLVFPKKTITSLRNQYKQRNPNDTRFDNMSPNDSAMAIDIMARNAKRDFGKTMKKADGAVSQEKIKNEYTRITAAQNLLKNQTLPPAARSEKVLKDMFSMGEKLRPSFTGEEMRFKTNSTELLRDFPFEIFDKTYENPKGLKFMNGEIVIRGYGNKTDPVANLNLKNLEKNPQDYHKKLVLVKDPETISVMKLLKSEGVDVGVPEDALRAFVIKKSTGEHIPVGYAARKRSLVKTTEYGVNSLFYEVDARIRNKIKNSTSPENLKQVLAKDLSKSFISDATAKDLYVKRNNLEQFDDIQLYAILKPAKPVTKYSEELNNSNISQEMYNKDIQVLVTDISKLQVVVRNQNERYLTTKMNEQDWLRSVNVKNEPTLTTEQQGIKNVISKQEATKVSDAIVKATEKQKRSEPLQEDLTKGPTTTEEFLSLEQVVNNRGGKIYTNVKAGDRVYLEDNRNSTWNEPKFLEGTILRAQPKTAAVLVKIDNNTEAQWFTGMGVNGLRIQPKVKVSEAIVDVKQTLPGRTAPIVDVKRGQKEFSSLDNEVHDAVMREKGFKPETEMGTKEYVLNSPTEAELTTMATKMNRGTPETPLRTPVLEPKTPQEALKVENRPKVPVEEIRPLVGEKIDKTAGKTDLTESIFRDIQARIDYMKPDIKSVQASDAKIKGVIDSYKTKNPGLPEKEFNQIIETAKKRAAIYAELPVDMTFRGEVFGKIGETYQRKAVAEDTNPLIWRYNELKYKERGVKLSEDLPQEMRGLGQTLTKAERAEIKELEVKISKEVELENKAKDIRRFVSKAKKDNRTLKEIEKDALQEIKDQRFKLTESTKVKGVKDEKTLTLAEEFRLSSELPKTGNESLLKVWNSLLRKRAATIKSLALEAKDNKPALIKLEKDTLKRIERERFALTKKYRRGKYNSLVLAEDFGLELGPPNSEGIQFLKLDKANRPSFSSEFLKENPQARTQTPSDFWGSIFDKEIEVYKSNLSKSSNALAEGIEKMKTSEDPYVKSFAIFSDIAMGKKYNVLNKDGSIKYHWENSWIADKAIRNTEANIYEQFNLQGHIKSQPFRNLEARITGKKYGNIAESIRKANEKTKRISEEAAIEKANRDARNIDDPTELDISYEQTKGSQPKDPLTGANFNVSDFKTLGKSKLGREDIGQMRQKQAHQVEDVFEDIVDIDLIFMGQRKIEIRNKLIEDYNGLRNEMGMVPAHAKPEVYTEMERMFNRIKAISEDIPESKTWKLGNKIDLKDVRPTVEDGMSDAEHYVKTIFKAKRSPKFVDMKAVREEVLEQLKEETVTNVTPKKLNDKYLKLSNQDIEFKTPEYYKKEARKFDTVEEFMDEVGNEIINPDNITPSPRLGELLKSNRLFSKFPDLKDVQVNIPYKDINTTGQVAEITTFKDGGALFTITKPSVFFKPIFKKGFKQNATGKRHLDVIDEVFNTVGWKVKKGKEDDLVRTLMHEIEHLKQIKHPHPTSEKNLPTFKSADFVREIHINKPEFKPLHTRGYYTDIKDATKNLSEIEAIRRESLFKTKEQLTDFYNQAKKGTRKTPQQEVFDKKMEKMLEEQMKGKTFQEVENEMNPSTLVQPPNKDNPFKESIVQQKVYHVDVRKGLNNETLVDDYSMVKVNGVFFTDNLRYAQRMAKDRNGTIYEGYINVRKPMPGDKNDIEFLGRNKDKVPKGIDAVINEPKWGNEPDIYGEIGNEIVVFDPKNIQIKEMKTPDGAGGPYDGQGGLWGDTWKGIKKTFTGDVLKYQRPPEQTPTIYTPFKEATATHPTTPSPTTPKKESFTFDNPMFGKMKYKRVSDAISEVKAQEPKFERPAALDPKYEQVFLREAKKAGVTPVMFATLLNREQGATTTPENIELTGLADPTDKGLMQVNEMHNPEIQRRFLEEIGEPYDPNNPIHSIIAARMVFEINQEILAQMRENKTYTGTFSDVDTLDSYHLGVKGIIDANAGVPHQVKRRERYQAAGL